jgi:hypothetical protein
MNQRIALCFIGVVAVICDAESALAISAAPTWQPRQFIASNVNLNYHLGADRILAFDHYGDPGIAYVLGSPNYWLMYARYVPGAGWQSAIADGGNRGLYPSLAFDRRELPVIGYSNLSAKQQLVASFNGTGWSAQAADIADEDLPYTGGFNSIAFDSTGKMATAYYHAYTGSLRYVKDTNGNGLLYDEGPQTVPGGSGYYASLAFDPLNRPMIAHQDAFNADLKFSVLDTGLGWVTVTVDSAGSTGHHISMAVDPDTGYPAISYFDNTFFDLRYAAWNGSSWDLTTVDSVGTVGQWTSLAFDPSDGNPAISYYDGTNGNLKLAWFNGTSWQTQPVDTVGDVGVTTSLAFNPYGNGFPSIVYGDNFNNLYFIEDPPASVPEPRMVILLAMSGLIGPMLSRRQRAIQVVRGSPDPAHCDAVGRPATTRQRAAGETNR